MMVSVLCCLVCAMYSTLCVVCSVQAKSSHWAHSISCVYCKLRCSRELGFQDTNGFQPQKVFG